jgi:multidrug efflux pump subunit AcrB
MQHGKFAKLVEQFFKKLSTRYESDLRHVMQRPLLIVGIVAGLSVVGGVTFKFLPEEFAPSQDIGRLFVTLQAPRARASNTPKSTAVELEAIAAREVEKGDITRVTLRVPAMQSSTGSVNNARLILTLAPVVGTQA